MRLFSSLPKPYHKQLAGHIASGGVVLWRQGAARRSLQRRAAPSAG